MGSTALLLVKLFAPNAEQMYIVNHLKESPAGEKRNVLEESARRAHEDIEDLADLNPSKLEAVIMPGTHVFCLLLVHCTMGAAGKHHSCHLSWYSCCPVLFRPGSSSLPGLGSWVGHREEVTIFGFSGHPEFP
ncbi:glutamine amidotransferase-like class 1 domain-containing protein 3A, mitochondrial isoform X2 [Zalophus californianus]|uniref:Glutamine amidotransferase-like class 1 domain-containing protein 3A, mitochondrial isoform X2 n=1 Tax=Zalophus californianus TaxID=9704 RepID=A0A6J2CJX0_ZALCA|nr:glutamine amidotransferase-like class 1 domain-containing protein 3A, mitochondrial isoform X2 [Zalophus californianus]